MLFIKLRDAIFTEDGYSLACPMLHKSESASFVVPDGNGKVGKVVPVPGCKNTGETGDTFIHLKPYADPEAGRGAVHLMCSHLRAAMEGDEEACRSLGGAWSYLWIDAIGIESQDPNTQIAMFANLYGAGRVADARNRPNGLRNLRSPDYLKFVPEALGVDGR